jgi:hypothetical protein
MKTVMIACKVYKPARRAIQTRWKTKGIRSSYKKNSIDISAVAHCIVNYFYVISLNSLPLLICSALRTKKNQGVLVYLMAYHMKESGSYSKLPRGLMIAP